MCGNVRCDCTLNGIPLYGKVEITTSPFADFDIEVVSAFADLDVQKVTSFANECGEWEIVTSFGDFTVREVESFGDFQVRYVNSFPGLP